MIDTGSPNYGLEMLQQNGGVAGFDIEDLGIGNNDQIQNRLVNNAGAYAYYGIFGSNYTGFAPATGGTANFGGYLTDVSIFTQTANDMRFYTNATEVARIKGAAGVNQGFMGIGSTTPWGRLSVSNYGVSGSQPLFVVASSTNGVLATSTYMVVIANGNTGIGTAAPDSTLDVSGTVRFEGASAFTSPSISGALIAAGCDTGDTTGLTGLASTTAFVTTPQVYPGAGVSSYTMALTPTSARTFVCSAVAVTPNASVYNVRIIK